MSEANSTRSKPRHAPLAELLIRRDGHTWTVIRRRSEGGETFSGLRTLEECFDVVRAAYDADGQPLPWPKVTR